VSFNAARSLDLGALWRRTPVKIHQKRRGVCHVASIWMRRAFHVHHNPGCNESNAIDPSGDREVVLTNQ
jgi:hypothetical protein